MSTCRRVQDHPFSYIPGDEILVIAPAGRGISSPIYNHPCILWCTAGLWGGSLRYGDQELQVCIPVRRSEDR